MKSLSNHNFDQVKSTLEQLNYFGHPIEHNSFDQNIVLAKWKHHRLNLLIDTGANLSCLSNECAHKLGVETTVLEDKAIGFGDTSELSLKKFSLNNLSFGELIVPEWKFIAIPLSQVNEPLLIQNEKGIDGILGNDLLSELKAILTFKPPMLFLPNAFL